MHVRILKLRVKTVPSSLKCACYIVNWGSLLNQGEMLGTWNQNITSIDLFVRV